MSKLTDEQKESILNSAIDDLEIVLDYLEIGREEKRKRKINEIKSTNENIIERAYNKLKQIKEAL